LAAFGARLKREGRGPERPEWARIEETAKQERQMRQVTLKSGDKVPVLGVGTWRMGERKGERAAEVAAIRLALDLGIRLVDTAEMYGEGGAEEMLAEALAGRRDEIFLVSKVYPHNAARKNVLAACERSLKRLKTDRLDLYLLHWPGSVPIEETVSAFETLRGEGKIRNWGVSNFDAGQMAGVASAPKGSNCASNQVLYHLGSRGIEWKLLETCRKQNVMVMAYSPLGQGPLLRKPELKAVAGKHGVDPAAVALAWVLRHPGMVTIPKAVKPEHVRANLEALDVKLDADDLKALDAAFPAPKRAEPLDIT
jgi:diketogulonate reductase-like aldo/keto reductase